jgi:hypothetical protein
MSGQFSQKAPRQTLEHEKFEAKAGSRDHDKEVNAEENPPRIL